MTRTQRVVAIVVTSYLLLAFLDELVLVQLLARRLAVSLLLAGFEALAAIGMGFIVRGLRGRVWRFDDEAARPDLALDLLLGVPLFGTLCFLVGAIRVWSWTMIPPLVVFGLAGAYAVARTFETRVRATAPVVTTAGRFALVAIVIVFLCALVAAQAPPSTLDELAYHLAVPWTWVKDGRAVELPLLSHAYFPLGVESASLPLLSILGNVTGGLASHLLHMGIALAATIVIARRTRDLLLTAAKYTFVPIAALILIAGFRRLAPATRWRVLTIGLALGSVFFIRNLILTGNPVAPFLSADAPHVTGYRGPAYLSSYVFDGHYIDESLGASLLGLAVATTGAAGWLMLVAGIALFALAPSARILVPFFAVAASQARAATASRALRLLLAGAIAAQLLLIVFFTERSDAFSLIAGRATEEQYLIKSRPSFTPVRALDASLPPDSRTLVVGLTETYWFLRDVRGGGNFDGPRVSRYLEAPTPEALYARLKQDGITHVAVMSLSPATGVAKKVEERDTELTAAAQRTLALTLDHYAANVSAPGSSTALFALR